MRLRFFSILESVTVFSNFVSQHLPHERIMLVHFFEAVVIQSCGVLLHEGVLRFPQFTLILLFSQHSYVATRVKPIPNLHESYHGMFIDVDCHAFFRCDSEIFGHSPLRNISYK